MWHCERCGAGLPDECMCKHIDRYKEEASDEEKARDTEAFIERNPSYIEMGIEALEIVANSNSHKGGNK